MIDALGWSYIAVLFLLGACVMSAKFTPAQLVILILGVIFLWSCLIVYMVPD